MKDMMKIEGHDPTQVLAPKFTASAAVKEGFY